jgi:two-component system, probable response regulator PhcQ
MYRVLLVDDEPNILNALRRCLAGIDADLLDGDALKLETFTSPRAAVERMEEQGFDLVISDYRMPDMNGVEFLSRTMDIQPAAPRIIISGFADRSAIIAAVNEVNLTRFIEKPWNDESLRDAVIGILGDKAKEVLRNRGGSLTASVESERQLRRLEQDDPGITHVERAEDGGIVIAFEDLDAED